MNANGNAFHAFTLDATDFLTGLDALDYYREPMQSAADMRLFDIVAGFRAAGKPQQLELINSLGDPQRALLALYAHRAATSAVRLKSTAWLESAMLASVIANYDIPENRKIDTQLAILHHCARLLGMSSVDLFDWAATYAVDPLAAYLEAFGRRDDVVLRKFGWAERRTPDGITFSARWE